MPVFGFDTTAGVAFADAFDDGMGCAFGFDLGEFTAPASVASSLSLSWILYQRADALRIA